MKKGQIISIHIAYWLIYCLLIAIFILFVNQVEAAITHSYHFINWQNFLMFFNLFITPGLISFYISYRILFEKLLIPKKRGKLVLFILLTSFAATMTGLLIMSAVLGNMFWFAPNFIRTFLAVFVFQFLALIHIVMALGMKGFFSWFKEIKQNDLLKQKNYETELALIQAQLNPHFLFNTLNNIDVLIAKDPDKASEYLNKLSEILRFMLYETITDKIPLSKELEYIQKYVALQKIRTKNDYFVQLKIEGERENILVPPLLFIPFIENAFKHVDRFAEGNAIDIRFEIQNNKIIFLCQNKYTLAAQSQIKESGLGMEIIQKRLDLIYGTNFSLEIDSLENLYRVKLIINF